MKSEHVKITFVALLKDYNITGVINILKTLLSVIYNTCYITCQFNAHHTVVKKWWGNKGKSVQGHAHERTVSYRLTEEYIELQEAFALPLICIL